MTLPADFPFAPPGAAPAPPPPPTNGQGGTPMGGGDGVLAMVVWPTHAGAVKTNGQEPMFEVDYKRGQIFWEVNEAGKIVGRATVEVPAGEWSWIIYCHNPLNPGFIVARKLAHPIMLPEAGVIDLHDITEDEVNPMTSHASHSVLHD